MLVTFFRPLLQTILKLVLRLSLSRSLGVDRYAVSSTFVESLIVRALHGSQCSIIHRWVPFLRERYRSHDSTWSRMVNRNQGPDWEFLGQTALSCELEPTISMQTTAQLRLESLRGILSRCDTLFRAGRHSPLNEEPVCTGSHLPITPKPWLCSSTLQTAGLSRHKALEKWSSESLGVLASHRVEEK